MDFIYGAVGGMFGTILSHPFDTIKSNMQTGKHINIYQCYKHNINNFGYTGLYRGMTAPFFGIAFEKSLVFGTYTKVYNITNNYFISGLTSGLTCSIITTPIEYIKINKQVSNIKDIKLINVYRGITPNLFREGLGYGIYFSIYNFLINRKENVTPLNTFVYGGITGSSAWLFIYPSDVIKTNMQLRDSKYKGIIDCTTQLYKKGGLCFFYKGFSLSLMRSMPLHAGVFFGYELCKKTFKM